MTSNIMNSVDSFIPLNIFLTYLFEVPLETALFPLVSLLEALSLAVFADSLLWR